MLPVVILFLQLLLLYLLAQTIFKGLGKLVFRVIRNRKMTIFIIAILFMFGTLVHELSHWLMAKVLFVPTGKLTLWPQIDESGVKLGSLQIAKVDPIRRTLIGIAPVLFGTILILISLYFAHLRGLTNRVDILLLLGYLIFAIGNTMFSSKKDLEGSWIFFLQVVAFSVGLYAVGVRINFSHEISANLLSVLHITNRLLLIPIGVDLSLVLLLKII